MRVHVYNTKTEVKGSEIGKLREFRDEQRTRRGSLWSEFLFFDLLLSPPGGGDGPILEVLQYQANPWQRRSKPLTLRRCPKISLISKSPDGGHIRY